MPPSKSEKSENAILELAAEIRAKRQYKEGVRATTSALKKTKLANTFLEKNLMTANPAAAHIGADEAFAQRTIAREEKDARDLGRILKLMAIAHMQGQNGG